MKKLLLTCLLAFGIGANAQWTENFDAGTTAPAGWTVINGGAANTFIFSPPPTGGAVSTPQTAPNVARITYAATAHDDYLVTPAITVQAGVNDRITFWVASYSSAFLENYDVKVATGNTAADFAAGTIVQANDNAAAAWTKKIIDLSAYVGQTIYVGFHATDTDQWYLMFDSVVNDTAPTTVPDCVTATTPADASTGVTVRPTFTWSPSSTAESYKLYLGTSSGNYDIINGVVASSGVSLTNNPPLAANTTYYMKIVPSNAIGDATGCAETTFTTGANFYAPYCGPFTSSVPTQIAPIKSVVVGSNTANTSDATATTVGTFATGEDFVSVVFAVPATSTSLPFTVQGIGITGNGWAVSFFIDWNNDGDFGDANESYFNTTATMIRSTTVTGGIVTLTGNITVPSGVSSGDKRLRVKYNFSNTTINIPLTTACTDLTNGQVEDYTLRLDPSMAASDVVKANGVSVYPNPFGDILKISDVKGVKSVSVNDMSGRQVKTLEPSAELNLSELKQGVYIVNLSMEDGSVKSFKAIKK